MEPIAAPMDWILSRSSQSSDDFVREHREGLYRLALSITGRPDLAEDAAQEALLRGLKHRSKLEDPGKWLRVVVARRALTLLKGSRAQEVLLVASARRPEEAIAVAQTLSKLSAEHRTLLALSLGEGWTYDEIAEALRIPAGTVASRLHAAKEAFRKHWGVER